MEEFKKKGYYPAGGRSQTSSAGSITYINTNSGLNAKNVQDALDELIADLNNAHFDNLLPYPYYEASHTDHGIDFTVNSDGTVSAVGTATANANMMFSYSDTQSPCFLKAGIYTVSGCPAGGSPSSYRIRVGSADASSIYANDYGDGATFTLESDSYVRVYAQIINGTEISDSITFKPMLEKGAKVHAYEPTPLSNISLFNAINQ